MHCKVGDEVQAVVGGFIKEGTVMQVNPSENQSAYSTSVTIMFTDGTDGEVRLYEVDEVDDQFQRVFRLAHMKAQELISEKLIIAHKALEEAEAIADEYGVPFSSGVSPLGQSYHPGNTRDKFPEVSQDFINDITETYNEYGGAGWEHSAVC